MNKERDCRGLTVRFLSFFFGVFSCSLSLLPISSFPWVYRVVWKWFAVAGVANFEIIFSRERRSQTRESMAELARQS